MASTTLRLVLLVALLFVGAASVSVECGKSPLKEYMRFEQILSSTDRPVGYSETFAALRKARFQIKQVGPKKSTGFLFQLDSLEELLGVFERDLEHCLTVFSEIGQLSHRYEKYTANLIPYLEECRTEQEQFCALLKQEKYLKLRPQFQEARNLLFDSTPVELEKTTKAIEEIQSELSNAKNHFGSRLLPEFEQLEEEMKLIAAARETSKYGCNFIFKDIARLSKRYQDKPNLLRYLVDCERLQGKFCQNQN